MKVFYAFGSLAKILCKIFATKNVLHSLNPLSTSVAIWQH